MSAGRLLAIDWGTSSLRGALIDADGHVIDQRHSDQGILSVPANGFRAVFDQNFGDWACSDVRLGLIAGMAGSRQGWQEAAYCACPAGFDSIATQLTWLTDPALPLPLPLAIVPGLSCLHPSPVSTSFSIPDVMRGEETQVLGAMRLAGIDSGSFVLPGTHSKWVEVEQGRIVRFRTSMTGELYALLSRHSLLARTIDPAADFDAQAFGEGVAVARAGADLLHLLFGTRTLSLFASRSGAQLNSYLSGLLIGEEIRSREPLPESLILIGSPSLLGPYGEALARCGVRTRSFDNQASWTGLHAIASATTIPRQSIGNNAS